MTKVKSPVSTVRMNRNYTSTGRDDDLRRVHEVLTGVVKEEMVSNSQSGAKHIVEERPDQLAVSCTDWLV